MSGVEEIQGSLEARGRRFAVVASSFNRIVVAKLVDGAIECLRAHGIAEEDVVLVWTPGAFELPLVAKEACRSGLYDGVICVGAIVRGETPHFQYIAAEAARGIQQVALDTAVPVAFGVLTTESMEQALARAGGKHGNKGWDAAMTAMEMASVLDRLPSKE